MIRKILLASIFSISFFVSAQPQAWYSVGTGITGDYGVLTETVYNGELYAGGWFYQAGGVMANNIARWNGYRWDSVGSGLTGGYNNVDVMCVYNGKLYAGGAFFAANGLAATNIAVWDGTKWDTVGGGLLHCGGGAGWADAMCVYNGKLYVAGAFCHAGKLTTENIACWDGTKWDSVSSGINDSVYALTVYNGKLYAGGQFTRAGHVSAYNIACWDGTTWTALGNGTNAAVLALQTYKTSLYVGGEFSVAGSTSAYFIASWNGSAWSAVGAGLSGSLGVEALCVYNGMLYTGGAFNYAGLLKTNNIATWNGTSWDTVSTPGIDNTVDALAVLDSNLYAGGIFSRAGSVAATDIAVWGGTTLGLNEMAAKSNEVTVYPNPNKGMFSISFSHAEKVSSATANQTLEVYNMLGMKIYSSLFKEVLPEYKINLGSQPAGVYLYRVMNQSGGIDNQGKIIIE